MKNIRLYTRYSHIFILAALFLFISFPLLFALPATPANDLPGSFSSGAIVILLANMAGIGFVFVAFKRIIASFQQEQKTLIEQIKQQYSSHSACEQAEKHFREIKNEWDRLIYKRSTADKYTSYEPAAGEMYTGGDALEKYYEDIQEYGEEYHTPTSEIEYHLRYILLLIKSFVSDLRECDLPDNQKKQLFRNFFYFYSAKAEFHLDNLYAETEGLAPFIQLHDETAEVQSLVEAMAAYYEIHSPND
jgi:hypothetical protein